MPDLRVDSVYNLTAIEEEQAKFLAFLAQSKSAILDLNNQRVVVKSSDVSTFTQASENLNKSVASSNTALKNITSTSVEYNKQLALSAKASKDAAQAKLIEAKAILEQEKADAIRTKSLIAQEKELERLIALEEKKNAAVAAPVVDGGSRNSSQAIQATEAQIQAAERLRDAEAQAAMSATEYGNSVNKSTGGIRVATAADLELEKARKAVAKANSTQNVELQGLNAQRSLANKAAKEEALTALGLLGPYKLLEKEYAAAAMNAKDLSVQYGINSVEAKAAAAQALTLNTKLQDIDKTVGQSQKNVGNYGSAFTKGLSSVWGGLRKIAYIIPGLGIAGLISMISGPLISAFQSWFSASKKIVSEQELLKNATSDFNKEFISASTASISKLELLRDAITNTSKTEAERLSALRIYNKVATDNNKIDEKQIDNLALINTKIADQIALIEHRALATASEQIVTDAATKLLLAREEARKKAIKQQEVEDAYDIQTVQGAKTDAYFKTLHREGEIRAKIAKDEGVKQAQAEFDAAKQIANQYVDFSGEEEKTKKDKKVGADSLQELKDRLNTEFDIYKIHQEAKIRLFDNDVKSESTYYLDKLTAFDNYLKAQKELLDREEQHEIDLAEAATRREKQHLEEQRSGKSDAEKARIDENIAINQKNLEQQILLIKAKYADEGNKLIEGAAETRNKIVEDHLKIEQDLYDQYSKDLQDNIDKDNERIKKGFEKRAKQEEDAAKEKIRLLKELHDQEEQLAEQAGNFLFSLATSGYENQLNLLTKQGEDIEKRKDQELAANDLVVQSTQDKAANVILINSRAQAQQDVIDRKAAAIKNKEAQFERAQQIFEIGINTIKTIAAIKLAIAEETIKAIANPLLTPLIGLIAAQIPVALASSALSIGAILATPLPRYKHGRGEKGEEFAIVGDGGVNEYIMRGTGQIEKTPAVNTLTHLMPKDKVYPNKESLMRELMFNNMQLSNYSVGQDGGINRNDIERLGSRLENSIGDIRIQTQLVTKSGWRNHNERLAQYDAWVNRVIKN
jgi:hypothetical protein